MKFEASQSRQMSQQRQFLSPHPFARRYKTGAVPRPVSLKAAISAQTNAPERAESISGHPARNPTPRQNRAVSPAANTDHIRRKGKALRSRTVRTRPAQASEPQPQQQGAERLRSAIRRMYKRAGADEGIVPLSYRRRSTPALAIRRTSGRVRASVGTTSPTAANGTPVLGNFQSARLFWRRTHSTARFASALPAAKGRTNTPSSSFWKARFINLFAGKSPPLPFIRRYTIPVVNAA